ncbi:MAG: hypothetical protein FJX72_15585, partial [Armatimonadetes bacterium]|nr:hypothetical protein [Armatimonadota bacterium]
MYLSRSVAACIGRLRFCIGGRSVNEEFLDALQQIAREKDISQDALREMVEQALITAYRKNFAGYAGEIKVRIDPDDNSIHVFRSRTVVD